MTRHFETSMWVPFPVELVFAFFANPRNMAHIMPPDLDARVEDTRLKPPPPRPVAADPARRFQSMAAGVDSEILISFVPIPWLPRLSWTARIVEFEWYSHFTDEQIRGPFAAFRHRHGISPESREGAEGTLVADSIEYALSSGLLGALAARKVWGKFEESFAYRRERLPQILRAASRQAVRGQGT
jgi:ligand-binding SRPBCC domain-containing protein